jgi:hypothetical protein
VAAPTPHFWLSRLQLHSFDEFCNWLEFIAVIDRIYWAKNTFTLKLHPHEGVKRLKWADFLGAQYF